ACCPPNVARTLASLGQYIYAADDDTITVNLFISSSFHTVLAGGDAQVEMKSDLMNSGDVAVSAASNSGLRLAIRIPEYAQAPAFSVDGAPASSAVEMGYVSFELPAGRHTVEIRMDVSPRWMAANPRTREDAGKVALMKGPCVYCLEEADNGSGLASAFVHPDAAVELSDARLPGGLPALAFDGERLSEEGWDDALYGPARLETLPARLTAVPYCIWGNRGPGEMSVWQKLLRNKK
ncbi:MAG: glycoside hydrolase family 127 protein, partial [Bacillota bacterium]